MTKTCDGELNQYDPLKIDCRTWGPEDDLIVSVIPGPVPPTVTSGNRVSSSTGSIPTETSNFPP